MKRQCRAAGNSVIFFVRDGLEPNDTDIAFVVGDGDVAHSTVGRRAVPVFDVRAANDDIAFVKRFDGFAFFLIKPSAAGYEQNLSRRMRMPVASRAGFKGHAADDVIVVLDSRH